MDEKFLKAVEHTCYEKLDEENKRAIYETSSTFHLSFQQIKQLVTHAADLKMWGGSTFQDVLKILNDKEITGNKEFMKQLDNQVAIIRDEEKDYHRYPCRRPISRQHEINYTHNDNTILGRCPVASEKTRCCNLQTLDAVINCGFNCSYCSIQSFYHNDQIYIDGNLKEKLEKIEREVLKPDQIYHIGTGQSSDSLLFGNKGHILEYLLDFARRNQNVILEFKSKSNNVDDLLSLDIPQNVITTWSLNTPTVSENEEHVANTFYERLEAAKRVEEHGNLIGFHFHPMVMYKGAKEEYLQCSKTVQEMFNPHNVAMVSMGTLTFIKPVFKMLHSRMINSKILQMPMEEIAGKYSYPLKQKKIFFKEFYDSFNKEWKDNVFFYMCMEDISLWPIVFGREYQSNEEFEADMKKHYMDKIHR